MALWASVIVFGIVYVVIATELLDKTAAALIGGVLVVSLGLVPHHDALAAIDLNVVFLLVGMMIAVGMVAETGLFEWMAIRIAQRVRGDGRSLLLLFSLLTAVLSAFLDNVTTVILVAPVTILLCQILQLPTAPYLILEIIASNVGGTSTLIGDPPNVIIGSATGLSFNAFLTNLTPPVLMMLVLGLPILGVIYGPHLKTTPVLQEQVMRARADKAILQPVEMRRCLVVLAVMGVGFLTSRLTHIEPGLIALGGGLIMALVNRADMHHIYEKVEWSAIFFFIGLFMMISALEHHGAFEILGHQLVHWTEGNFALTLIAILWCAAMASAIVDNIPLVIAMIPLIQTIAPEFAALQAIDDPAVRAARIDEPLYWSLALGACLGGNGTLIGASANVVVAGIAKRNGMPISFVDYARVGLPSMLFTVLIATGWVWWRYL